MTQDTLRARWDAARTAIFRVLNDEGENMGNAQVRRIGAKWLHVDDVDGFQWIDGRDIGYFNLETTDRRATMASEQAAAMTVEQRQARAKAGAVARWKGGRFAVVDRDGYFRDETKVYNSFPTVEGATRFARRNGKLDNGKHCLMVIMCAEGQAFVNGEVIYGDMIRRDYPVVF